MARAIVATVGLPASGKSTWTKAFAASHPEWILVNNDDIRIALHGHRAFRDSDEHLVVARRVRAIQDALGHSSVVLDNCNLSVAGREEVVRLARLAGAQLYWVSFLDVPLDECLRRDALRPDPRGERLIRRMHTNFLAQDWEPPADQLWAESAP